MNLPGPSLKDYVTRWAAARPLAEAAVEGGRRLTYRMLQQEVDRWVASLQGHGVVAGDRVATLSSPGIDSFVCLLATVAMGGLWCGLDPRLRPAELKARLMDLDPKLFLVTGDEYEDKPCDTLPKATRLDAFLLGPTAVSAPPPERSSDAACMIVYTSGSSGNPKGALLKESSVIAFCERQNAVWPVDPLRTLNFLPISHAGSLVDLTLPALVGGGCVIFQAKFDALESLALIERERVSFWASVPSTFLLQTGLSEFATTDFSSVQLIAIEGAAIPESLAQALIRIAPVATNYGMTETTSGITVGAPTRSVAELLESVGRPFDDVELRIAGTGRSGEIGEIEVRSPRCIAGYWRSAEASRSSFTEDAYFRTGDLGMLLPDGRLALAGRTREMFKSGGYNVFPAEVERVLDSHPEVDAAAVVPRSDPLWGEVGVAFVTAKQPANCGALEQNLKHYCEERLANFKRPKRICLLDAMPLVSLGKIDRQALRKLADEMR